MPPAHDPGINTLAKEPAIRLLANRACAQNTGRFSMMSQRLRGQFICRDRSARELVLFPAGDDSLAKDLAALRETRTR
jgi:hypothetical protein